MILSGPVLSDHVQDECLSQDENYASGYSVDGVSDQND